MKCIHIIGTVGVPACYGGFETLVEYLTDHNDVELVVYCSGKTYPEKKRIDKYKNAKLIYLPFKANGLHSVIYDIASMFMSALKKADAILILGVSGCLFLPILRVITKAKIVTNIDGLEWRREKWGKFARLFLKFSERLAVRYSDVIISDNQAIADYVKCEYGVDSIVIAYGGDHAKPEYINVDDKGYALALCRIEPENNISMILDSFSNVSKNIIFVGNWGNSQYGIKLREKYSVYSNIQLLDPIYDINKLAILRAGCSFYVHGHSAGGTNPSLVEMMHFGKDIFCYDCNYNRATTEDKASYFFNSTELIELIENYSDGNINFTMSEIASRRYTWEVIRRQYFGILMS